ncbi:pyridoxamine 5'-phosphate oxidase family protein, partial [Mycobacterium sp.]
MAKEFPGIDASLRDFIAEQAVFFVATAPSEGGRINLSPKGYCDTFAVLDDRTVAYLDLFGSGVETIAHLRDNGRITVMFCSFTRSSRILRLFGTGRV